MRRVTQLVCVLAMAVGLVSCSDRSADAGHPVYYAAAPPVMPAVVGYSARRGGVFGQRVVMRPVVAPVVAAPLVMPPPVVRSFYYGAPISIAVPVSSYRVPYGAYYPVYGY